MSPNSCKKNLFLNRSPEQLSLIRFIHQQLTGIPPTSRYNKSLSVGKQTSNIPNFVCIIWVKQIILSDCSRFPSDKQTSFY